MRWETTGGMQKESTDDTKMPDWGPSCVGKSRKLCSSGVLHRETSRHRKPAWVEQPLSLYLFTPFWYPHFKALPGVKGSPFFCRMGLIFHIHCRKLLMPMVPYQQSSKHSICPKYLRLFVSKWKHVFRRKPFRGFVFPSSFSLQIELSLFFNCILFMVPWGTTALQEKYVLMRPLSAKCVTVSSRWLKKWPSTIPQERPQELP